MRRRSIWAAAILGLLVGTLAAKAQTFPTGPVRIIVCFAAGGGVDITARLAAQYMQQAWSTPAIVDNRPGAGCNIGAEAVSRAAPDGQTILASAPSTFTVNKVLYRNLRYDPEKLEPVSISVITPIVLAVPATSRIKSAEDFLKIAKAEPGKLIYASQGVGSTGHLTAAFIEQQLGTTFIHVPHNGAAPAINALAGAQVDFMFSDLAGVRELAASGQLRLLATTTEKRVPSLNLPTFQELGFKDFIGDAWWGFAAPPGTPLEIRNKIAKVIAASVMTPEVSGRLEKLSVQVLGSTPTEMAAIVERDRRRWTEVVRTAHFSIE